MKYKGILIDDISLFKHPAVYLELFLKLIIDGLKGIKNLVFTRYILLISLAIIWTLLCTIESLYSIKAFIIFAVYWILLGVASSIGLGTGLHTFVLYLGPHIAKVAIIANQCGYIPQMLPSRWDFDHFATCTQQNVTDKISFFGIILAVQLQSFLWGFGTALGQLPPYFAAYKASKTKYEVQKMHQMGQKKHKKYNKIKADDQAQPLNVQKQQKPQSQIQIHPPKISQQQLQNEQIQEIQILRHKQKKSIIDRAKICIFDNMQKYGFITILFFASVPNPVFDLAGITCGHFRIPLRKFFFPTFIGKAINKVHVQMVFVIAICRKQGLQTILSWIASISQSLSQTVKIQFQKQKKAFHNPQQQQFQSKPLLGVIWDLILILMIGYFLFSIVNGLVLEKAMEHKDKNTSNYRINEIIELTEANDFQ